MKILIDMNLSPDWTAAFAAENIESVHWSTIGEPRAEDTEIMDYARMNDYIVFTHDLDFGTILALTQTMSECRASSRTKHFAFAFGSYRHCSCEVKSRIFKTRRVDCSGRR